MDDIRRPDFERILELDDGLVTKVMRETDSQELSIALRGASAEIQDKILKTRVKNLAGLKGDRKRKTAVKNRNRKSSAKNNRPYPRFSGFKRVIPRGFNIKPAGTEN